MNTCNSTYFYSSNVIKWIAEGAMAQFTIYEIAYMCKSCNYVAIKSLQQLCHYIATTMPLYCNYYAITLQLHR
jgi:hypothetical protein